jgi:twinkle protein
MEINGFEIDQYNIHGIKQGTTAWTCPKCSDKRKPEHRNQKCMSVNWTAGIGHCNHCGEKTQLHTFRKKERVKEYKQPARSAHTPVVTNILEKYSIEIRGISKESLDALKVSTGKRWMPKAKKEIDVIEFPYFVEDRLVNVKYRGANKDFMFEPGCEVVMFNLNNVMHESECIVVEGEWDALSFVEAGFMNVTSVPNGFTLPRADGTSSINMTYLDDYWPYFGNKEKIFLAVDNDLAGNHGKKEMIRRFGAEKCWQVDFKDCKDANEYLKKYGKEALAEVIGIATPIPLENVVTLRDFRSELENFYLNGSPKGWTTGLDALDENYSIEPGQYTIVTGAPQSGKSELVDSICLGYALKYGYRTAFASPENKPDFLHADKIIRKICGYKPSNIEQVKSKRVQSAMEFYQEYFCHLDFNEGFTLTKIIAKFKELVKRNGIRIFVIDPYNKTRLKESYGKQVNDYTSDYLQEIDIFCKETKSIVYLVAHPTKMKKTEGTNSYPMATAYDIKGGGEMFDMAYHILGVTRNMEGNYVQVKTLKVKFQHLGKFEESAYFKWNVNNGRYVSLPDMAKNEAVGVIEWDNESWVEYEVEEPKSKQMEMGLEAKKPDAAIAAFEMATPVAVAPRNFYEVEKVTDEIVFGDASTAPF